ncbi:hypothetical protein BGZ65_001649 [Modicella reniformis]|uniref:Vacuole protein n=1 Tax=Modicella reniformis TaxID=1440133 RepID=A0A9P6MLQ7_9FUNG|nr:hypothetical protein BGZ65_001649 [Modicella reniformis]
MGAQWKREKVQDHKFDFINVDDFVDNSWWRQFRYILVFVSIMRGVLVYCSDIFTAVNLFANSNANSFVSEDGLGIADLKVNLPYSVYKILFTVCIVFGFLLLALEIRRARGIIKSRDISHAFTSQIASRYYTVRSYPHYCFFAQINNSKKTVDEVAFFCFFTFRNWKRLMLADAPRQTINATILYQVFHAKLGRFHDWNYVVGSGDSFIFKKITLGAMIFTVVMFALSLFMLIVATILYIPLVSHIRGNLKEFCCHKIDKRIDELIKKNTKDRAMNARGGKNKDTTMNALKQQPTLPQLDLLEAPPPPPPTTTPRNVYNQPYSPRNGNVQGYGQQQGNGFNLPSYKTPSPQVPGYSAGYSSEDYFQAKPPPMNQQREAAFDPYAGSAFTEDVYDAYNSTQDQQHPGRNMTGGDYYSNKHQRTASRTRRYDDYSHQQTASPLPSQHGSDLIYPAGNNGYVNNHYGNADNGGRQGYGNDYYPSVGGQGSQTVPQRPQRQGTAPSRGNGGY